MESKKEINIHSELSVLSCGASRFGINQLDGVNFLFEEGH